MAQALAHKPFMKAVTIAVQNRAQMKAASDAAEKIAAALGFAPAECAEVALAARELASNLVTHAGSGEIQVSSLAEGQKVGIQIVSQDSGPGIHDVECALADGFSTAGGLGNGLGAVNRLMDSLEFSPCRPSGLRVVCQRWVRPTEAEFSVRRLAFGAATRSYHFQPDNGDALVIRRWSENALAGVIDGLGHGQFAHRAAQTARQYIEHHFDQPLENIFRGVGRACRATRGVVMALARFELSREKVVVATLGNIEVRLLGAGKTLYPLARRGIVGLAGAPEPVLTEYPWMASSLLIMHSDGIRSAWQREQLPEPGRLTPAALAHGLLERFGRPDDDATVLVVNSSKT